MRSSIINLFAIILSIIVSSGYAYPNSGEIYKNKRDYNNVKFMRYIQPLSGNLIEVPSESQVSLFTERSEVADTIFADIENVDPNVQNSIDTLSSTFIPANTIFENEKKEIKLNSQKDIYDIDLTSDSNIKDQVDHIETELSINIPSSTNTEVVTGKHNQTKNKIHVEIEPALQINTNNAHLAQRSEKEDDITRVPEQITEATLTLDHTMVHKAPPTSYFPLQFGENARGAIAIANSFSTGDSGSATSHAVAYGSPEAAQSHSHIRSFF